MADYYHTIVETLTLPTLNRDCTYNRGGIFISPITESLGLPTYIKGGDIVPQEVIPYPIEIEFSLPSLVDEMVPRIPTVSADYVPIGDWDYKAMEYHYRKCRLTAVGTNEPPGFVSIYTWDFGDGSSPDSGKIVYHTFPQIGHYDVRLIWLYTNGLITISGSIFIPIDIPEYIPDHHIWTAIGIKYVPAGGNLDQAKLKTLVNNEIWINHESLIARLITSQSPAPLKRVRIGRQVSIRAALAEIEETDFNAMYDAQDHTLQQDIVETVQYDVRLILINDAGQLKALDFTNLRFVNRGTHNLKPKSFEPIFIELIGSPETCVTRSY